MVLPFICYFLFKNPFKIYRVPNILPLTHSHHIVKPYNIDQLKVFQIFETEAVVCVLQKRANVSNRIYPSNNIGSFRSEKTEARKAIHFLNQ